MASRSEILQAVARAVPPPVPPGSDCVLVGVDGVDAAGKTRFADDLATVVRGARRPVVRVSLERRGSSGDRTLVRTLPRERERAGPVRSRWRGKAGAGLGWPRSFAP